MIKIINYGLGNIKAFLNLYNSLGIKISVANNYKDLDKYDAVINYLSDLNDENLKDAFIFDFYENKKLNEIKVGVRFIFQSNLKTLSEEDIQKSVNKLLKPIIDFEGISIPGL